MKVCRSLTFVLSLASMANLLLSLLYILTDVLDLWLGGPFHFVGLLNDTS